MHSVTVISSIISIVSVRTKLGGANTTQEPELGQLVSPGRRDGGRKIDQRRKCVQDFPEVQRESTVCSRNYAQGGIEQPTSSLRDSVALSADRRSSTRISASSSSSLHPASSLFRSATVGYADLSPAFPIRTTRHMSPYAQSTDASFPYVLYVSTFLFSIRHPSLRQPLL